MSYINKIRRLASVFLVIAFLATLGGCGGSSGNQNSTPAVALTNPAVRFAVATGPSTLQVAWGNAGEGATYEIHTTSTQDAEPNSSSLRKTVLNLNEASLENLQAATEYHLRIVAISASGERKTSSNTLTITTLAEPLQVKSGLVVQADKDLDLVPVEITDASVTFRRGLGGRLPAVGTVITGQVDSGDSIEYYLRRVVSVSESDLVRVETTDINPVDLFQRGKIVTVFLPTDAEMEKLKQQVTDESLLQDAKDQPKQIAGVAHPYGGQLQPNQINRVEKCTGSGSVSLSKLIPKLSNQQFNLPRLQTSIGFDEAGRAIADLSLNADWRTSYSIELESEGEIGYTCSRRLAETDLFAHSFLVPVPPLATPIPVVVSAVFAVEAGATVTASQAAGMRITGNTAAAMDARMHYRSGEGVTVQGLVPKVDITAKPYLLPVKIDTKTEVFAYVDFLAEAALSAGFKQTILGREISFRSKPVPFAHIGVRGGPTAEWEIMQTPDAYKMAKPGIKPFHLKSAAVAGKATAYANLGVNIDFAGFFELNIGAKLFEVDIAKDVLIETPKFEKILVTKLIAPVSRITSDKWYDSAFGGAEYSQQTIYAISQFERFDLVNLGVAVKYKASPSSNFKWNFQPLHPWRFITDPEPWAILPAEYSWYSWWKFIQLNSFESQVQINEPEYFAGMLASFFIWVSFSEADFGEDWSMVSPALIFGYREAFPPRG